MSDTLQLVDEVPYAQLLSIIIRLIEKKLNLPHLNDKLKHIGHLVAQFLGA